MNQSERWTWFWFDLLEILAEEYWICPYCGSTAVAEVWEVLAGRFRNGDPFGPYGGYDNNPVTRMCDDCNASWDASVSPMDCIDNWREWEHIGKMIKL